LKDVVLGSIPKALASVIPREGVESSQMLFDHVADTGLVIPREGVESNDRMDCLCLDEKSE
jgi:hypothetical protein